MYLWKNFFQKSSFKMRTFCIWLLDDFRIKMIHLNNLQNEGVKDEDDR